MRTAKRKCVKSRCPLWLHQSEKCLKQYLSSFDYCYIDSFFMDLVVENNILRFTIEHLDDVERENQNLLSKGEDV